MGNRKLKKVDYYENFYKKKRQLTKAEKDKINSSMSSYVDLFRSIKQAMDEKRKSKKSGKHSLTDYEREEMEEEHEEHMEL